MQFCAKKYGVVQIFIINHNFYSSIMKSRIFNVVADEIWIKSTPRIRN